MPIPLLKLITFTTLALFSSQAFAEYYVVRTTPPSTVVVCNSCTKHKTVSHKKYTAKKHCKHYASHPRRSTYKIVVYYPVVSPCCAWSAPCDYCSTCNSCGGCGACNNRVYYQEPFVERTTVYRDYYSTSYYYDEGSFDFDRRTADDVGADMDIDY